MERCDQSLCSVNVKITTRIRDLEAVYIMVPCNQLVNFKWSGTNRGLEERSPPNTSDLARHSAFMSREHSLIAKSSKQASKSQKPTIKKNKRSEMHTHWAREGVRGHLAMTRIVVIQHSIFHRLSALPPWDLHALTCSGGQIPPTLFG